MMLQTFSIVEILQRNEVIVAIITVILGGVIALIAYLIRVSLYEQLKKMNDNIDSISKQFADHITTSNEGMSSHLINFRHEDIGVNKQVIKHLECNDSMTNVDLKVLEGKFLSYEEKFEDFVRRTEMSLSSFNGKFETMTSNQNTIAGTLSDISKTNSLLLEQIGRLKNGKANGEKSSNNSD